MQNFRIIFGKMRRFDHGHAQHALIGKRCLEKFPERLLKFRFATGTHLTRDGNVDGYVKIECGLKLAEIASRFNLSAAVPNREFSGRDGDSSESCLAFAA